MTKKPERAEGETGWCRRIARQATETGAIEIDWDFAKSRYFVTDCDLREAIIIDGGRDLEYLMNRYGFTEANLT